MAFSSNADDTFAMIAIPVNVETVSYCEDIYWGHQTLVMRIFLAHRWHLKWSCQKLPYHSSALLLSDATIGGSR